MLCPQPQYMLKEKKRKALLLLSISDDAAHYITVTIIAFYIPAHAVLLLV